MDMKNFFIFNVLLLFCAPFFIDAAERMVFVVQGTKNNKRSHFVVYPKLAKHVPLFLSIMTKDPENKENSWSYTFENSTKKDLDNFSLYVNMLNSDRAKAKEFEQELNLKSIDFDQLGKLIVMLNQAYVQQGEGLVKAVAKHLIDPFKDNIDHKKEDEKLRLKKILEDNDFLTDFIWEATFPKTPKEDDDCFSFVGGTTVNVPPADKLVTKIEKISFFSRYKKLIGFSLLVLAMCMASFCKLKYQDA